MNMLTKARGQAIQEAQNARLKASGLPGRVEVEVVVRVQGTRVLLRLREKDATVISPDTGSQRGLA